MGEIERIETIVLGVYDEQHPRGRDHTSHRRRAIVLKCSTEGLPSPDFSTPDHVQALTRGCELSGDGKRVILVGGVDDLRLPEGSLGSFGIAEWREAWLAYLFDASLGWVPTGAPAPSVVQETTRASVIRAYQHSCQSLRAMIAKIKAQRRLSGRSTEPGFVYGRPPYGYCVLDGRLTKDQVRAPRVRRAFQLLREGNTIPEAAAALQKLAKAHWTVDGKPEFWDAKKIRRLLNHSALYCLGEYKPPAGAPVRLASLAILPKDWINVVETVLHSRSA